MYFSNHLMRELRLVSIHVCTNQFSHRIIFCGLVYIFVNWILEVDTKKLHLLSYIMFFYLNHK